MFKMLGEPKQILRKEKSQKYKRKFTDQHLSKYKMKKRYREWIVP